MTADEVIARLQLRPHPVEGGHFRETWRGGGSLMTLAGTREAGTAIYYLLSGPAVSEMHKLPGTEVYHFYLGDPLELLMLKRDGSHEVCVLGTDLVAGELPQVVIPGGVWQGSCRRARSAGFTLIGATMGPGFDYLDYETGSLAELVREWPAATELIAARVVR